jgi:hypothetical protein
MTIDCNNREFSASQYSKVKYAAPITVRWKCEILSE